MAKELLKGKTGLISGALNSDSIAWQVAEKALEQGAKVVITNSPIALRMGEVNKLAEKCATEVVSCDATKVEDLEKMYDNVMTQIGGKLDFVLHSIGMSPNVRKQKDYDNLDYHGLIKTLEVSAISFHKMLQVAKKKDAISEYGSVVALSYIGAQRSFYDYGDMSEAKAMLESIARSFGYKYGIDKKVRVNTVSQSPTLTTAGKGIPGFEDLLNYAEDMSPIGNASAASCADLCVSLFSDLTRGVTMQNIFNDGGFSSVGVSSAMMDKYTK